MKRSEKIKYKFTEGTAHINISIWNTISFMKIPCTFWLLVLVRFLCVEHRTLNTLGTCINTINITTLE